MANLRSGTLVGGSAVITYRILLDAIKTIDGHNSGIDADLLDGYHADHFATANHLHDDRYVKKVGDRLTGTLTFDINAGCGHPVNVNVTDVAGGWARGITYASNNNSIAGLGVLGAADDATYAYMGIGSASYDKSICLAVYKNDIRYKDQRVWYQGNDGAGSGLDADLIDGIDSERIIYGDNNRGTAVITQSNILTKSGFYYPSATIGDNNTLPEGSHSGIIHYQDPTNDGYFFQIAAHFANDNKIFFRQKHNGHIGEWNRMYHTGNRPTPSEIDAIRKSGDTGIGKLEFATTANNTDPSIVINGPNAGGTRYGSYATFRGITVKNNAAGSTMIGAMRGDSYDSYFALYSTTQAADDFTETLKVGAASDIFTYKG
ncbi:hypothetical protein V6O07_04870, partial [Arthrospira platensis SPKY2]